MLSQQFDLARWKDPTWEALANWFSTYKEAVAGIPLEDIYNMDKTGFAIGTEKCSRVIINQGTLQTRYKTHPGRQEWVSVVECISASSTAIFPLMIFKGQGVNANLVTESILAGWCFVASTND